MKSVALAVTLAAALSATHVQAGPAAPKMTPGQITASTSNLPTSTINPVPLVLTLVILWAMMSGGSSTPMNMIK